MAKLSPPQAHAPAKSVTGDGGELHQTAEPKVRVLA